MLSAAAESIVAVQLSGGSIVQKRFEIPEFTSKHGH